MNKCLEEAIKKMDILVLEYKEKSNTGNLAESKDSILQIKAIEECISKINDISLVDEDTNVQEIFAKAIHELEDYESNFRNLSIASYGGRDFLIIANATLECLIILREYLE